MANPDQKKPQVLDLLGSKKKKAAAPAPAEKQAQAAAPSNAGRAKQSAAPKKAALDLLQPQRKPKKQRQETDDPA